MRGQTEIKVARAGRRTAFLMFLGVAVSTGLSACGSGPTSVSGGSGNGASSAATGAGCVSISGGDTLVSSSATPGSSVSDEELAIDSDFGTYATMIVAYPGSATSRATTQPGVIFPSGSTAGVLGFPAGDESSHALTIRTYLNGLPQETAVLPGTPANDGPNFYGFKTLLQFDAVEVEYRVLSAELIGLNGTVRIWGWMGIYEFCSDVNQG